MLIINSRMNKILNHGLLLCLSLLCLPGMACRVAADTTGGDPEASLRSLIAQEANGFLGQRLPWLKIKYVSASTTGNDDGWAAEYDWSRTWGQTAVPDLEIAPVGSGEVKKRFRFAQLGLRAHAKGSYAYGGASNNQDLSTAGFSLGLDGVDLGWVNRLDAAAQAAVQVCIASLGDSLSREEYDAASRRCGKPYFDFKRDHGSHAYSYRLGLDYQVEANDNYGQHHEVYGVKAVLAFAPASGSLAQRLNLFDYPFRYLTRPFSTGGADYDASYPSVCLALEHVDPTKNTARNQLPGGAEAYERLHLEVAFSTRVLTFNGTPVTFEGSYRIYRELSAPEAVRTAGLDEFNYGTAMLYMPARLFGLPGGRQDFYLGYSSGELPFDQQSSEALEIGWRSDLSVLPELLGL